MTTVSEFIADVSRRGGSLRLEGAKIIATPAPAITADDKAFVTANRQAVMSALRLMARTEEIADRLRGGARVLRETDPTTDRWAQAMALFLDGERTLRNVLDFTGCCCEGDRDDAAVVCDACVTNRTAAALLAEA